MSDVGETFLVAIRVAVKSDLPQILVLEKPVPTASHWNANQYQHLIDNGLVLLAEREGSIRGFITVQTSTDEWEIENVVVSEECQRRGVATRLIRDVMDRARHRKVSRILLEVRESNQSARALYQKLGFTRDGTRSNYYRNPEESAFLYSIQF